MSIDVQRQDHNQAIVNGSSMTTPSKVLVRASYDGVNVDVETGFLSKKIYLSVGEAEILRDCLIEALKVK